MPVYCIIGHSCCLNKLSLLVFIILFCPPTYGQSDLEEMFETASDGAESPDLYETLESLRVHPLDLNLAGYEDLMGIPWITPSMARKLVEYRTKNGPFVEPAHLVKVSGFSSVLVDKLLPYLRTSGSRAPFIRRYKARMRAADHYPRCAEYSSNPFRLYSRTTAMVGDGLSFCALAEKDPYERRLTDMLSFHAHAAPAGMLKSVVAGDYWLDFAEGLVLGESRYMTKGSGSAKGSERGIVPNRSSVESGWLRGGAVGLNLRNVSAYCFASRMKLDARVNEQGLVMKIYTDGLHRTETELAKVGKLAETVLGARAALAAHLCRIGLTGFAAKYQPAFAGSEDGLFSFEGSSYGVMGTDVGVDVGPIELFGELARTASLGEGYVVGMSYRRKAVDLGLIFRHYDQDYYNPHSAAFGDSDNNNEEGAYLEVGCKPSKGTKISGFMDMFRTLGPTYGSPYGTHGRELRLEVEQKLRKRLRLIGRVYSTGKEKFLEEEGLFFDGRTGFRLQGDYTPSRGTVLRARFETVFAPEEADSAVDKGSMLYWEAAFEPASWARLRARFSVFRTDSWDARLYQHESDLPGVMRNVAVSGMGAMGYVLGSIRSAGWFKLSGKISWKRRDGEAELRLGLQTDFEIERGCK